ncbi:MAG: diacylglycerol kinase family protein [Cyanophyceae cyanobacterium]
MIVSNPIMTGSMKAKASSPVIPLLTYGGEKPSKSKRSCAWQVAPNLLLSFRFAWAGVRYAFATQRNFRVHTGVAVLAVSLGFFLKISSVEMTAIIITCALVMVLELLNTAIESVVDLTVKQTYHELAKIAKDCAAGAVLVAAVAAVLVASCILLPPLWALVTMM